MVSSFFRRGSDTPAQSVSGDQAIKNAAFNMFSNGTPFDLHIYLSESRYFNEFRDPGTKVHSEFGLLYGDWYSGPDGDGCRTFMHSFKPSEKLLNNGSIYLHVYVTAHGKSPDPKVEKKFNAGEQVAYSRKMLNKFKKVKYRKTHNLLTGETQASKEEIEVGVKYN